MISGALLFSLLIGFAVGTPLRRQDDDGKYGYEYDVKHPLGNSRVHVRAGGDRHQNSYPGEYISDASYLNPHYAEPLYQPNRYGHYPTSYNRVPSYGHNGGKVPVYEEHLGYPKPSVYHQGPPPSHNPYGIHHRGQDISQSHLDIGPIYEKPVEPVYSSPPIVQQAAIDDLAIDHPPSKIEQIALDPKPAYDVVPIVEKVEQIPSEPFVVQQSADLHEPQLPLELDQQVLVDEPEQKPVILQEPLEDKQELIQVTEDIPPPKVILVEPESPIVQQSSVDIAPPSSDVKYIDDDVIIQSPIDAKPSIKTVIEPPVVQQVADVDDHINPLSYSDDVLHRSGDPVVQTAIDKYPSQTLYGPGDHPTHSYNAPPKYQFVPVGPPYEKISHSTEIIHGPPRGPLSYHSVKLPPPPPSTKSISPPLLQQQEYVDVPLNPPTVKLPPPPPPSIKLPPPPPSVKLPPPPPLLVQEPVVVHPPHSVKLPPPVYKSPPLYKPIGGIKSPPYSKVPAARYPPVSHSVKQPYATSYYFKTPPVSKPPLSYVPLTKSPVPYSVKRPYSYPPVSPNPGLHYGNPHVKAPYFRTPVTKTSPISHGVKHPVVSNVHSVKHPKPVAAVKGYPSVKLPPAAPHLEQSPYVNEPPPPISHSIKHPHNTAPVLTHENPHLKHPHQGSPVKKYLPVGHVVETPYSEPEGDSDLSVSPEIPYSSEEISPLQKYPPVSHSFQISPVIPPPEPKSESSISLSDEVLDIVPAGPSPLDKYPPVSHSILLPVSKPPAANVPNLFAAVPSSDDDISIESPLSEKAPVSHSIILPSPISEPKVSALRSDALSYPVSHPVRLGARRNRERYGEPKQDFPAFPVESAYGHPDPVADKVAHLSNSFGPRRGYGSSHYEPEESESSNSPSVEEAKSEIDRVNKDIGLSFGDRIPGRSRLS